MSTPFGRRRATASSIPQLLSVTASLFSLLLLLLLLLIAPAPVVSLETLGRVFSNVKPPAVPAFFGGGNNNARVAAKSAKSELLGIVESTSSGKDAGYEIQSKVLDLVRIMETNDPPSPDLLTDPSESKLIDGDWYLRYTQPYDLEGLLDEEQENVDKDVWKPAVSDRSVTNDLTRKSLKANASGSVSFLGLVNVGINDEKKTKKKDDDDDDDKQQLGDESSFSYDEKRATIQTIDVKTNLFRNSVEKDFGTISVEGSFVVDSVPNRIVASFTKGGLTLNNGFVVDFSFLFAARAILRKGSKEGGWLETTYVDETMRIGRGNRGSLFVLTRDRGD